MAGSILIERSSTLKPSWAFPRSESVIPMPQRIFAFSLYAKARAILKHRSPNVYKVSILCCEVAIEEKRRELDDLQAASEEAEKAEAVKAAERALAKPTSAAEAKAKANALFGAGKVCEAAEMSELALEIFAPHHS